MRNVTILLAVVAVLAMAVGTAQASPLLYDGFNYSGGVLDNVSGGGEYGFKAGTKWVNGGTLLELTTDGTSLSYPNGTSFTATGNRISESGTWGTAVRDMDFTIDLTADGDVWYASMLLKASSSDKLFKMRSSIGSIWYFGQKNGNLWGGIGGNNPDIGPALDAGATYFIVSKIVTSTGTEDEGYIKAYKVGTDTVPSSEPAVGSWDWEVYSSYGFPNEKMTYIMMELGGNGDEIDEIRMGHTWVDVAVPEPATMVLLGIGGLGVLIRRRRK